MSTRDLVVLGSASAVPTRTRNHNGYLLRWDGHGLLFDPGEGTQRQMARAGLAASDVTWICVTHFHGDHCLGVPGVIQRIARDGVAHPVHAAFPASGTGYWRRLRHATIFKDTGVVRELPIAGEGARLAAPAGDGAMEDGAEDRAADGAAGEGAAGEVPAAAGAVAAPFTLTARRLSHPVEAYGFRLAEPGGVTLLPAELTARGVTGPLAGRLQREGRVTTPDGRTVRLGECSVPRRGQRFAFVMDTRLCDAVFDLADGADLLVIESTFLDGEAALAREYGHLTAGQAGRVAADAGVRRLVLTHFSERYGDEDEPRFREQAAAAFGGDIVVARDLDRVAVPARRRARAERPGGAGPAAAR